MEIQPHSPEFIADTHQVDSIADLIYTRTLIFHLKSPRVGIDQITDCLDAQVLRVLCYERHHIWIPFEVTLPISIAESPEAEIMARLARSDFVFLTESGRIGSWPFDRQAHRLLPKTKSWCEDHLLAVESLELFGQHLVLYERPEITPAH
jgi:hypothetical protein